MAEKILTRRLQEYLKKLHSTYKNDNKNSLTDILNSFKQISDDYNEFNENQQIEYSYSNVDLLLCNKDEQRQFYNDQLQLIECLLLNKIYDNTGSIYNRAGADIPASPRKALSQRHVPAYCCTCTATGHS